MNKSVFTGLRAEPISQGQKMKMFPRSIPILLIYAVLWVSGCASQPKQHFEYASGQIQSQDLLNKNTVFAKEYAAYQPTEVELAAMQRLAGKSIIVLFGEWCHDSEREVPRLLKLIDSAGVSLASVELYAVDFKKQEPSGSHERYGLQYTPTIILLDNQTQLGRIIERPVVSLAEDLAGFLPESS